VYRELFEEMLESSDYYVIPSWIYDILNEFIYQFQGFCQVRSALYATARKQGLVGNDGNLLPATNIHNHSSNLLENLTVLKNSTDAWDIEVVYSYLNRLAVAGFPQKKDGSSSSTPTISPTATYLSIFCAVSRARLECLLGDYMSSLEALMPLSTNSDFVVDTPGDDVTTSVTGILHSVFGARLSVAYHAGVCLLMLRRYRDAIKTLGDMCTVMQRGFKTGQLRKLPGLEQFNKQYDRMLALLAILNYICPTQGVLDDPIVRLIREKHATRLQAASSYEDWFQSPKFVSVDPNVPAFRQQVQYFLQEMEPAVKNLELRSYLKLYTSLPVEKLAKFHDQSTEEFMPRLLSYKLRSRQLETGTTETEATATAAAAWKVALDIHFYVVDSVVHVDEVEKQRRFENYFVAQIAQANYVGMKAAKIDPVV
jgi:translation initiation factor 3 subunit L